MPWPSCPPEIKELMVSTCKWEKWLGFDGHGEPQYAVALTLQCSQEAHSMLQTGLLAKREAEVTEANPQFDLYFAGDDPSAEEFSLYDRFTTVGVGNSSAITKQPASINTVFGPFDNKNPWVIVVAF